MLGVDGRDEARGVFAFTDLTDLVDLAELAGFLLAALVGLTGVLKSGCSLDVCDAAVKLDSLIGDTEDLLLAADLRCDGVGLLLERFALPADAAVFFLIEAGVLAVDFGLGVAFIGFGVRFAGVGVCLAILNCLERWNNT